MQTLVSIPYIVEAQKNAAMRSGVSFLIYLMLWEVKTVW